METVSQSLRIITVSGRPETVRNVTKFPDNSNYPDNVTARRARGQDRAA
jgi:hypothetical protein